MSVVEESLEEATMNVTQRTRSRILLSIAGMVMLFSLSTCRKKNEVVSGGGSSTQSVLTMKGGAR
jgi:hypothetical protein